MNPKLLLPALLFATFLLSCNRDANVRNTADSVPANSVSKEAELSGDDENKKQIPVSAQIPFASDSNSKKLPLQASGNVDWDKKIIKTAEIKLEVKDFKKYSEAIHNSIKQYGGYIAQDEQNITGEKLESVLSIKVPVQQFEPMVNNLSGSDIKVLERKISSQDVTGEMVDTKSRLEAKKQVRLKYLNFLKASKNMDEVLKVQAEINTIQEEIEAASARVQYLSHQSSFSTINLTFYQPVIGFQPTEANPSFLTRAIASFNNGGKWIAEFLLALVSIWPLLLIISGAFVIYKKVKPFKIKPQKL